MIIISINNDFYCLGIVKYRHLQKVNDYMPSKEIGTPRNSFIFAAYSAKICNASHNNTMLVDSRYSHQRAFFQPHQRTNIQYTRTKQMDSKSLVTRIALLIIGFSPAPILRSQGAILQFRREWSALEERRLLLQVEPLELSQFFRRQVHELFAGLFGQP